jgi:hypothetical protein
MKEQSFYYTKNTAGDRKARNKKLVAGDVVWFWYR